MAGIRNGIKNFLTNSKTSILNYTSSTKLEPKLSSKSNIEEYGEKHELQQNSEHLIKSTETSSIKCEPNKVNLVSSPRRKNQISKNNILQELYLVLNVPPSTSDLKYFSFRELKSRSCSHNKFFKTPELTKAKLQLKKIDNKGNRNTGSLQTTTKRKRSEKSTKTNNCKRGEYKRKLMPYTVCLSLHNKKTMQIFKLLNSNQYTIDGRIYKNRSSYASQQKKRIASEKCTQSNQRGSSRAVPYVTVNLNDNLCRKTPKQCDVDGSYCNSRSHALNVVRSSVNNERKYNTETLEKLWKPSLQNLILLNSKRITCNQKFAGIMKNKISNQCKMFSTLCRMKEPTIYSDYIREYDLTPHGSIYNCADSKQQAIENNILTAEWTIYKKLESNKRLKSNKRFSVVQEDTQKTELLLVDSANTINTNLTSCDLSLIGECILMSAKHNDNVSLDSMYSSRNVGAPTKPIHDPTQCLAKLQSLRNLFSDDYLKYNLFMKYYYLQVDPTECFTSLETLKNAFSPEIFPVSYRFDVTNLLETPYLNKFSLSERVQKLLNSFRSKTLRETSSFQKEQTSDENDNKIQESSYLSHQNCITNNEKYIKNLVESVKIQDVREEEFNTETSIENLTGINIQLDSQHFKDAINKYVKTLQNHVLNTTSDLDDPLRKQQVQQSTTPERFHEVDTTEKDSSIVCPREQSCQSNYKTNSDCELIEIVNSVNRDCRFSDNSLKDEITTKGAVTEIDQNKKEIPNVSNCTMSVRDIVNKYQRIIRSKQLNNENQFAKYRPCKDDVNSVSKIVHNIRSRCSSDSASMKPNTFTLYSAMEATPLNSTELIETNTQTSQDNYHEPGALSSKSSKIFKVGPCKPVYSEPMEPSSEQMVAAKRVNIKTLCDSSRPITETNTQKSQDNYHEPGALSSKSSKIFKVGPCKPVYSEPMKPSSEQIVAAKRVNTVIKTLCDSSRPITETNTQKSQDNYHEPVVLSSKSSKIFKVGPCKPVYSEPMEPSSEQMVAAKRVNTVIKTLCDSSRPITETNTQKFQDNYHEPDALSSKSSKIFKVGPCKPVYSEPMEPSSEQMVAAKRVNTVIKTLCDSSRPITETNTQKSQDNYHEPGALSSKSSKMFKVGPCKPVYSEPMEPSSEQMVAAKRINTVIKTLCDSSCPITEHEKVNKTIENTNPEINGRNILSCEQEHIYSNCKRENENASKPTTKHYQECKIIEDTNPAINASNVVDCGQDVNSLNSDYQNQHLSSPITKYEQMLKAIKNPKPQMSDLKVSHCKKDFIEEPSVGQKLHSSSHTAQYEKMFKTMENTNPQCNATNVQSCTQDLHVSSSNKQKQNLSSPTTEHERSFKDIENSFSRTDATKNMSCEQQLIYSSRNKQNQNSPKHTIQHDQSCKTTENTNPAISAPNVMNCGQDVNGLNRHKQNQNLSSPITKFEQMLKTIENTSSEKNGLKVSHCKEDLNEEPRAGLKLDSSSLTAENEKMFKTMENTNPQINTSNDMSCDHNLNNFLNTKNENSSMRTIKYEHPYKTTENTFSQMNALNVERYNQNINYTCNKEQKLNSFNLNKEYELPPKEIENSTTQLKPLNVVNYGQNVNVTCTNISKSNSSSCTREHKQSNELMENTVSRTNEPTVENCDQNIKDLRSITQNQNSLNYIKNYEQPYKKLENRNHEMKIFNFPSSKQDLTTRQNVNSSTRITEHELQKPYKGIENTNPRINGSSVVSCKQNLNDPHNTGQNRSSPNPVKEYEQLQKEIENTLPQIDGLNCGQDLNNARRNIQNSPIREHKQSYNAIENTKPQINAFNVVSCGQNHNDLRCNIQKQNSSSPIHKNLYKMGEISNPRLNASNVLNCTQTGNDLNSNPENSSLTQRINDQEVLKGRLQNFTNYSPAQTTKNFISEKPLPYSQVRKGSVSDLPPRTQAKTLLKENPKLEGHVNSLEALETVNKFQDLCQRTSTGNPISSERMICNKEPKEEFTANSELEMLSVTLELSLPTEKLKKSESFIETDKLVNLNDSVTPNITSVNKKEYEKNETSINTEVLTVKKVLSFSSIILDSLNDDLILFDKSDKKATNNQNINSDSKKTSTKSKHFPDKNIVSNTSNSQSGHMNVSKTKENAAYVSTASKPRMITPTINTVNKRLIIEIQTLESNKAPKGYISSPDLKSRQSDQTAEETKTINNVDMNRLFDSSTILKNPVKQKQFVKKPCNIIKPIERKKRQAGAINTSLLIDATAKGCFTPDRRKDWLNSIPQSSKTNANIKRESDSKQFLANKQAKYRSFLTNLKEIKTKTEDNLKWKGLKGKKSIVKSGTNKNFREANLSRIHQLWRQPGQMTDSAILYKGFQTQRRTIGVKSTPVQTHTGQRKRRPTSKMLKNTNGFRNYSKDCALKKSRWKYKEMYFRNYLAIC